MHLLLIKHVKFRLKYYDYLIFAKEGYLLICKQLFSKYSEYIFHSSREYDIDKIVVKVVLFLSAGQLALNLLQ